MKLLLKLTMLAMLSSTMSALAEAAIVENQTDEPFDVWIKHSYGPQSAHTFAPHEKIKMGEGASVGDIDYIEVKPKFVDEKHNYAFPPRSGKTGKRSLIISKENGKYILQFGLKKDWDTPPFDVQRVIFGQPTPLLIPG